MLGSGKRMPPVYNIRYVFVTIIIYQRKSINGNTICAERIADEELQYQ